MENPFVKAFVKTSCRLPTGKPFTTFMHTASVLQNDFVRNFFLSLKSHSSYLLSPSENTVLPFCTKQWELCQIFLFQIRVTQVARLRPICPNMFSRQIVSLWNRKSVRVQRKKEKHGTKPLCLTVHSSLPPSKLSKCSTRVELPYALVH